MTAQSFIFDSYHFDWNSGELSLRYSFDDQEFFTEKILFDPEKITQQAKENKKSIEQIMFHLHLIAGVSYYKSLCPKNIEIRSSELTEKQAQFWNTVYTKGLGEFFYENQIDFRGLINFPYSDTAPIRSLGYARDDDTEKKSLLGVGGGKDTIVSAKKMEESGKNFDFICIGKIHPSKQATADQFKKNIIQIQRQIDPKLIEWNTKENVLNGHVPITAINTFMTLVAGYLYGHNESIYALESSADEGNLIFCDMEINHQWSKSSEFEQLFNNYTKNLGLDFQFSSNLRKWNELRIVKEFAQYSEFFPIVTSCNKNFTLEGTSPENRWCGKCGKCEFVFALFSAYIPKAQMLEIFGRNFYEDYTSIPTFNALLGLEGNKPFECVGTQKEMRQAMSLASQSRQYDLDPVMLMFQRDVIQADHLSS
ncbi:MAG: hypothetical protein U9Q15_01545 [Patescibacteria group bacterium]|nr:hypothetical protein [Patescibacteria group bacterium]